MTLITSMRKRHGAILLSDSQETVRDRHGNEFKYAVLKATPERIKGFHFVIAGGGDGDAIDELAETFKRELKKSTARTLDAFKAIFERCLKRELAYLNSVDKEARIELIVAATKGRQWEVWRNVRRTLVSTPEDCATLVGFDAEVYKHAARTLFPLATTGTQVVAVGLRILELARQSSTCVDAPYHAVVIIPGGVFPFGDAVIRELTESVTVFGASLDRLLLACADTSLRRGDFEKHLQEFANHVRQLREDYLQAVADADFKKELELGLGGIELLPADAIRTVRLTKDGPKVTVEQAGATRLNDQTSEDQQ